MNGWIILESYTNYKQATTNVSSDNTITIRAGNNRTGSTIGFDVMYGAIRPASANLGRPRRNTTSGLSESAPSTLNTGGVLRNSVVPAINIDRPTSPMDIPDGGASRAAYVDDSDTPPLARTVGMLDNGHSAFVRREGRLDVPRSDGDSASIRSYRSTDDIAGMAMHMSEDGNSRPGTPSAGRPRSMTEAEVSRDKPMSLGHKVRNKPGPMTYDGACSGGVYEDVEDDDSNKRKREVSPESTDVVPSSQSTKNGKKVKLTQTTLNLGQARQPDTCRICNFLYQTYTREEGAEHDKVHQEFVGPIIMRVDIMTGRRKPQKTMMDFPDLIEDHNTACIVTVEKGCDRKWKDIVERALKLAERDMGALHLHQKDLWSVIKDLRNSTKRKTVMVPRFKVYLAVMQNMVLSILVAERIFNARVINMRPSTRQGEFEVGENGAIGEEFTEHAGMMTDNIVEADMGVHYVWTHKVYRRCGLATRVLNFARHGHFIPGLLVTKDDVAWTDPTEDGKAFHHVFVAGENAAIGEDWEYLNYQL